MKPTQDEIYTKVSATLVEALNVDEEDIKPTSTLQGDLGAESIDFLDIVFRLEREFDIKIPRGELFPESVFQGNPEFVSEGQVTDRGMGELRWRSSSKPLSVTRPFCTNSGSPWKIASGNSSPRGILIPNSRSRRNTMSRKSIDSAPRSPTSVACGLIWSSSTLSASTSVEDTFW